MVACNVSRMAINSMLKLGMFACHDCNLSQEYILSTPSMKEKRKGAGVCTSCFGFVSSPVERGAGGIKILDLKFVFGFESSPSINGVGKG